MPAYVVVNVDVHDAERYASYTAQTPASIASFGGRFIARGGRTELLEGDWEPKRLVIIEFPDYEAAKAWYFSPEYTELKQIRLENATSWLLVTEGT